MSKFLTELQNDLQYYQLLEDDIGEYDWIELFLPKVGIIHIGNILELIKQNRFDDLQSYINDECALTPNKNYTYRLRDKIANEILYNIKFIEEIENN